MVRVAPDPEPRHARARPRRAGCAESRAECVSDDYYGTRCRSSAFDATTLHINNGNEPEYLDPTMAHDTASSALISQLFEGLTTYGHGDMRPVAAGAIAYDKSDDNRYFRFHLRPDAKWSDGKPVTARDYEYTWRRLLRPETASQAATTVYAIKNAELVNQGKLRVAKGELALLDAPRAGSAVRSSVPKGTAVRILAESPRKVLTALPPLAAPKLVPGVDFDAKAGSLAFSGEKPEGGGEGGAKGSDVEVLEQGPSIECNGEPSHYFLSRRPAAKGTCPAAPSANPPPKSASPWWSASTSGPPTRRPSTRRLPPPRNAAATSRWRASSSTIA
jgi:oligopeptide transport system substrate-binding protein